MEVYLVFAIGELIVYGSDGVFVVSAHATSPIDKHDDRVFYVLKPLYGNESDIIFTPADNQRVTMRCVMSRDDAFALIYSMPNIPPLRIENEKKRRLVYRDAMSECRNETYVSIIKSVQQKKEDCISQRKRLSESDSDYDRKAKYCLYGELAVALGIGFNEVEGFIIKLLEEKADIAM
jgi:CarD family transcriptional regulator